MTGQEYVDKAIKEGKEIIHRHANGYDYMFIKEPDGWYSIFNVTGGIHLPEIQARDIQSAENYIYMIEPAPVWLNEI